MTDWYEDMRFFVKAEGGTWSEVDADGFKAAERRAGFRPKGGTGFATGGFSGHGTRGTMMKADHLTQEWCDEHPYHATPREIMDDLGIGKPVITEQEIINLRNCVRIAEQEDKSMLPNWQTKYLEAEATCDKLEELIR